LSPQSAQKFRTQPDPHRGHRRQRGEPALVARTTKTPSRNARITQNSQVLFSIGRHTLPGGAAAAAAVTARANSWFPSGRGVY
jgi:hypothetical protein